MKVRVSEMKKIYGVIGDPIAHSMSPAIHNDAFQKEKLDADYISHFMLNQRT